MSQNPNMPQATAPPDLTAYDIILVSSSAGKDSQAALDVVVELARRAGVLSRVVVVHADLGGAEWPGTAELAAEHAAFYNLRFETVARKVDGQIQTILDRAGIESGPGPVCPAQSRTRRAVRRSGGQSRPSVPQRHEHGHGDSRRPTARGILAEGAGVVKYYVISRRRRPLEAARTVAEFIEAPGMPEAMRTARQRNPWAVAIEAQPCDW